MTFHNNTLPNVVNTQSNANSSNNPFVDMFESRDPTANDIQYPIQKKWLNTVANRQWELKGYTSTTGFLQAVWVKVGAAGDIETLTGDTGGPVGPDSNFNINTLGTANQITVTGNPATHTETWSLTNGIPIASVGVDAHTAPGTNPVLPTNAGLITVTGGQVAAGTTVNVIRTDSLAANAYTIEIQRASAQVSSTIGANGVAHFKASDFSVDANGFVALTGSAGFDWNVINQSTQPANFLVNNGYICQAGGTGNVSIALPAVSVLGDIIEIVLDGATSWTITQAASQSIRFSNSNTTVGTGGSIATTGTGDALRMVCETANLKWVVLSAIGNLTVT